MQKTFLSILFILAMPQFFTHRKGVVTDNTQTSTMQPNSHSVIDANNKFGFNFFKTVLQQDTSASNKLISPLSIYLALSMVYNGADNATKDSIANTLQLSGISIDELNNASHKLTRQLAGEDRQVQLSIANSIWYNKNVQPVPSFPASVSNFYDASVKPLDFSSPTSVAEINNWVNKNTGNKIPKVIDKINPGDLMYLINAIYFNGAWQHAFKKDATANDIFNLQNGSTVSVPFMNQQFITNTFSDNSFSMIELPYGKGKNYSMYILLPVNAQQTISSFASSMNETLLKNAIGKMDSSRIRLSLPSWEAAYSIDNMKPELSSLGMGIAFSNNADFSKMYSNGKVNITKAVHKTYIKVNEQGTIAAATTSIGMHAMAVFIPLIKINRPFMYAIIEKKSGAVLFLGTVNNPSLH